MLLPPPLSSPSSPPLLLPPPHNSELVQNQVLSSDTFSYKFQEELNACIVFNNLQDLLLKSILLKQQMLLSLISLKLYIGMKSSCACQLGTPDLTGLK